MRSVIAHLEKQSRRVNLILSFSIIAALGLIDYLTGHETAFAVFYLLPVSIAAYFIDRRAGVIASFVSAIVWLAADFFAGQRYSLPVFHLWSGVARLIFFLVVTMLLSALRQAYEHQKELACTDYLTGTVNARSFFELAQAEILRARRYNHPYTVAYVDVDNFKAVNDSFGHAMGDELLRLISKTIKNSLRATDVVARLGGDEFALLLPETGHEAAEVAVRDVRERLSNEAQKIGLPVTFSIGVLTCSEPPPTVEEMIKLADNLMYSVKKAGKNHLKHEILKANLIVESVPER